MSKSLQTLKTNIVKGSQRLSKATVKNIVNAGEFEKIELAYSYDGREVHKGDLIENPVEWFNKEYDSIDVRLHKVENNLALIHLQFHSNLWYSLFIDLKKVYPSKQQQEQEQVENKTEVIEVNDTKNYLDTMQTKFKTGEGSAVELRSYYTYLLENVKSVKVVILDMLNNSEKHKRKRKNTKTELTDDCYNNMIEALVYHVQDSLSFEMDFSDMKGAKQRAIKAILDNATDEMIKAQYTKNKADKEERTAQRKETIEGILSPQTLEDFQNVKYYRKDKTLTIEEQQRYDLVYSISQKEKREKEQQERVEKALVLVTGSNDKYTITADVDTRDNSPLWVVKLIYKVDKDEWKVFDSQMKLIDGYYSRFKRGHIFKYDPTTKLLGEQTEENQVEQPEQTHFSNNTDKLRKVADNMQNTIDSKRADRKTNTAKRAREAAGQEEQANNLEHTQSIIRNIANAIESGELTFIDKIDSRVQIETLESILNRANWKYKLVENIDYKVWHNSSITIDVIKYAEIPSSTIYLRQLQSIINDIRHTDGFKLIANRLQKVIDSAKLKQKDINHDPLIDISDYDAELDKIYKNTDVLKGQYFETAVEERRRLSRMGIDSVEELRAYLREYFNYRTVKSSIDPTEQKIKELERKYKLDQKGDINFTPSNIALQLIEHANIDHNSRVLEPSAGIGNIADQIKKFCDNVDVCEQMYSYQELLTLKGFNVVGSDFLKYENNNYYDSIIMNPPFSDEQNHIKHAYDLLKTGGKLIAITSPHWGFANDKSSKEFRQWFENLNGEIVEELESGTFEMSQVRSNIIVINKDTETMQKAV